MQSIHIVYSSDNNYAQHLGASLYSLLTHNADTEITIHIIDNGISAESKEKLTEITRAFPHSRIDWIDFSRWSERLHLHMQWQISLSSYGRLFIGSMLSDDIVKCLYLDCDMILCNKLDSLWDFDMNGHTIAAVQDTVNADTKENVGLHAQERYFNAGLLLIDLEKWRRSSAEAKCMRFIADHNGSVTHHDQGVLNGIFHNDVSFLPLKYNVMTIQYSMNRRQIMKYFHEESPYYSDEEIRYAKANPVILHFTPSFTTRPWVKTSCHPKKNLYWDAVSQTPWNAAKPEPDRRKWYVRLIEWRYRKLLY